MKAATITKPYEFAFSDIPEPVCADDEALLKIDFLGICGSDMQIYKGLHKYMTLPVIPGHEFSATIVEVGKNVSHFQAGDRVTMDPKITCGKCYPCEIGRPNACEQIKVMGVHAPGAAMEYILGKPERMYKIPEGLSSDTAALTEPLAVAVGSIRNCGDAIQGANVAIMGAGTIGNLTAQAARALGAGKIMLCDIDPNKLKMAQDIEADFCINLADTTLKEAIVKYFGAHRQADILIDCTGAAPSFDAILEASRGSSLIVITGLFKHPVSFEVPRIQRRDIRIIGSHMYTGEDFAKALELLAQGKIHVENFITDRFAFPQISEAFAHTAEHSSNVLKTLFQF